MGRIRCGDFGSSILIDPRHKLIIDCCMNHIADCPVCQCSIQDLFRLDGSFAVKMLMMPMRMMPMMHMTATMIHLFVLFFFSVNGLLCVDSHLLEPNRTSNMKRQLAGVRHKSVPAAIWLRGQTSSVICHC